MLKYLKFYSLLFLLVFSANKSFAQETNESSNYWILLQSLNFTQNEKQGAIPLKFQDLNIVNLSHKNTLSEILNNIYIGPFNSNTEANNAIPELQTRFKNPIVISQPDFENFQLSLITPKPEHINNQQSTSLIPENSNEAINTSETEIPLKLIVANEIDIKQITKIQKQDITSTYTEKNDEILNEITIVPLNIKPPAILPNIEYSASTKSKKIDKKTLLDNIKTLTGSFKININ